MFRNYPIPCGLHSGTIELTSPSAYALSLEDAKLYLRLSSTAEDALISALIKAAENKLNAMANISISYRELEAYYVSVELGFETELPSPKHREIVSVSSIVDNVYTDLDASEYMVFMQGTSWKIKFLRSTAQNETFAVRYWAGFADEEFSGGGSSNVPDELLLALKTTVAAWFEKRGIDADTDKAHAYSIPPQARALITSLWFNKVF